MSIAKTKEEICRLTERISVKSEVLYVEQKLRETTSDKILTHKLVDFYSDKNNPILCGLFEGSKWVFVSQSWERVTGYTVKELTAHPKESFIHPDDIVKSRLEEDMVQNKRVATIGEFVNRYRCKGREYRYVHLLWYNIGGLNERLTQALAMPCALTMKTGEVVEICPWGIR